MQVHFNLNPYRELNEIKTNLYFKKSYKIALNLTWYKIYFDFTLIQLHWCLEQYFSIAIFFFFTVRGSKDIRIGNI